MRDVDIIANKFLLHKEFKKLYKPKTAFGNIELISIGAELARLTQIEDETEECPDCGGDGLQLHECDCEKCNYEDDECEGCRGNGRIAKEL